MGTRTAAVLVLAALAAGCTGMQFRVNDNTFPPEMIYEQGSTKGAEAPLTPESKGS